MTTIWKFPLLHPNTEGISTVSMPEFAEVLSVGIQGDSMVVWALVDPADDVRGRDFFVFNTGADIPLIPAETEFVGTVSSDNGIVWHVWVRVA